MGLTRYAEKKSVDSGVQLIAIHEFCEQGNLCGVINEMLQ